MPGLLLQVLGRISPWVLEKENVPLVFNPNTFPERSAPRPLPKPCILRPTASSQACPAPTTNGGKSQQHQLPEEGPGGHHPRVGCRRGRKQPLPLGRAAGCLGRFSSHTGKVLSPRP